MSKYIGQVVCTRAVLLCVLKHCVVLTGGRNDVGYIGAGLALLILVLVLSLIILYTREIRKESGTLGPVYLSNTFPPFITHSTHSHCHF